MKKDDRFSDLVHTYLVGLGLAAIFVIDRGGDRGLMLSTDLVSAIRALERDEAAIVERRFWFSNAAVAERVYRVARSVESEGGPHLSVGVLEEAVYVAAAVQVAEVKPDANVAAQCTEIVTEIERQIDRSRASGALQDVNRSYKQHRKSLGDSALSYEVWLHRYKMKAVESAAHRVRTLLRQQVS